MLITKQDDLDRACKALAQSPFITVDTEFLRERTYFPVLCLIQLAAPDVAPVAVDPLEDKLDLTPLFDLLFNERIVKVFHAARQDLEIIYNLTEAIPAPLFDTQIAAMVCGHGEQIGYGALVSAVCKKTVDKGSQFTDWSRRPLSDRQLTYALEDVSHLRDIYMHLSQELTQKNRIDWVAAEMAVLNNPATYANDPDTAWQRIKIRSDKPKVLAALRELAAWREEEAQRRDVPRGRILKDESLAEIAVHMPRTIEDLALIRGLSADMARGKMGKSILDAIEFAVKMPPEKCPTVERGTRFPSDLTPVLEMLKMLLRIQAAQHDVAAKIIASSDDLEAIAMDDAADVPALQGWRLEVFGRDALALKHGKIALSVKNGKIQKAETP